MTFGEKIHVERTKRGMNQKEFGQLIGVSTRIVSLYETNKSYPRTREDYARIATTLNLDVNYLLTENEEFVMGVGAEYGPQGAKGAERVLADVNALFAGGEMADEDLDTFMEAVQKAYWEVKKINKEKYSSKKNTKENND